MKELELEMWQNKVKMGKNLITENRGKGVGDRRLEALEEKVLSGIGEWRMGREEHNYVEAISYSEFHRL